MGNYATCNWPSDKDEDFEILESLAIRKRSYNIEVTQADTYQEEHISDDSGQEDSPTSPQSLSLLVIGAIGAAKCAVINYIANYFEGGWLGNLKFVIPTARNEVNIAGFPRRDESECTVFTFKRRKYTLTVIDTPEFSLSHPIDADLIKNITATVGPITGMLVVIDVADCSHREETRSAIDSLTSAVPDLRASELLMAYSNGPNRGNTPDALGLEYQPALQFALPESPFQVADFQALPFVEKVNHYVQWVTLMHNIRQALRVLQGEPLQAEVSEFNIDTLRELFNVQHPKKPPLPAVPAPLAFSDPSCSTLLLLSENPHEKTVFLSNFAQSALSESPLCAEVTKQIAADPTAEFILSDEQILAKSENSRVTGCTKFYFCTHELTHVVIAAPEVQETEDNFADPEYVNLLAREILGVGVLRSVIFAVSEQRQHQKLPGNIVRMFNDVTGEASVVVTAVVVSPTAERMRVTCANAEAVGPGIKVLVNQKDWAAAGKVFQGIMKMQEILPPVKVTLINPNVQRKEELKALLFQITENLSKSLLIVDTSTKALKTLEEAEKAEQEHPDAPVPSSAAGVSVVVSNYECVETPCHNTLCKHRECRSRYCHTNCSRPFVGVEGSEGIRSCCAMEGDEVCHVCGHGYQWHLHAHYIKEYKESTFQEVYRERTNAMQVANQSEKEKTLSLLTEERGKLAVRKQSLLDHFRELKKVSVSAAFFSQEVNEMYQILLNTHQKLQDAKVIEESDSFLSEVKRIIRTA